MKRKEITTFIRQNRNFNFLWASQGLSQVTLNMINFVMATRIYEKTGSTLAVSFLWVFYYLPAFFLGPFSGFFVDLLKRRKILFITNFLQCLTMVLFLLTRENIYPIYPIVFLYSFLNQFYCPAESASLPWLVKKSDLPLANSLFMITTQSALVLGLSVSGILIRFFGDNIPVWISIVSLFLAAVAVYFLPKNEPERQNIGRSLAIFWDEVKAGYSFVKETRIILFPILLAIVFQAFLVIMGVMLPGFAGNILKIKIADAGPLLIVPLGLGTLSGAVLMSKLAYKYRKRVLMKNGFGVVFAVLLFFTFILPWLGQYKTIAAMPLMFFIGLAGFFIVIPNQTLIQEHTPEELRGRVYGTLGFLGNLVTLPCLLFAATVIDMIGVKIFLFLAAAAVLLVLLSFDKIERYILSKKIKVNQQLIL